MNAVVQAMPRAEPEADHPVITVIDQLWRQQAERHAWLSKAAAQIREQDADR